MRVEFIQSSSLADFEMALSRIAKEADSLLILSCDENHYNSTALNSILATFSMPIIGGIFPQIIYKNKNYKRGTLIISLNEILEISIIEKLSHTTLEQIDEEIESTLGELDDSIHSMFVFVDGLSQHINDVILALFENYGLSINYIGAGAGSLSFEQKPCLFSNKGLLEDAAILTITKRYSAIGVKHGWKSVSEPFNVTYSKANKIIELDYKPALEVYKEVVESLSKQKITDENFFEIAKAYPLGINKLSGEMVVRDPIMIEESSLVCVGDVAVNAFVSILHGTNESLVTAAKEAKDNAYLKGSHFTLFIDCISRVLFMDELFHQELEAIYEEDVILIGALSLGEIANNKKHYLEFYNKTSVVANIERFS